jgi:hypothetical protein
VTPEQAALLAVQLPNPDELSFGLDARAKKRARQIGWLLKAPDINLLTPCLTVKESK